jgi:hypothetical protein
VVGAGYDIHNPQTPALYYFPPNPTNAAPNFVLIDNVNSDPSLTSTCALQPAGCVSSLVDTVVAQTTVNESPVAAGDMLVLVGDAYSGTSNGKPVVLRLPAASVLAATTYFSSCLNSFGNTSGTPPPCVTNSGGSPGQGELVTQATMASVLGTGESPVSMDISPIDGSLFIATSNGNIFQVPLIQLSPTTKGYGNPFLYAYGQYGMQQLRVGQLNGQLYVFATVQDEENSIVMYVGAAPTGGFGYSSGVTSAPLNGTGVGLAVLSPQGLTY